MLAFSSVRLHNLRTLRKHAFSRVLLLFIMLDDTIKSQEYAHVFIEPNAEVQHRYFCNVHA